MSGGADRFSSAVGDTGRVGKVLLIANAWMDIRGGIEYHADRLSLGLTNRGVTVSRETVREFSGRISEDVDWIIFDGVYRRALLQVALRQYPREVHKAIFTHGSFFESVYLRELGRNGYFPSIPTFAIKFLFDRMVMSHILSTFDYIFVLSEKEREDVSLIFDLDRARIVVSPPLGEPPLGDFRTTRPSKWDDFIPYICSVSRIDKRKNLTSVLRVMKNSTINYLVAGQDCGGLNRLKREASRNRVRGYRYLGIINQEEKFDLLRSANATIVPSFFEGIPNIALESLRQGTAVIVTGLSYMGPVPGVFETKGDEVATRLRIDECLRSKPIVGSAPIWNEAGVLNEITSLLRLRNDGEGSC